MGAEKPEIGSGARGARTPTITAVVGAYNAKEWIGETVSAILSQTHPPDEVIVVDDGSTDETMGELERFGGEIRIVTQSNGGCPAAFNRAFAEARGDYVAMCGADDVWEPAKLERQVAAIAAHPEIDVALGGAWNFGLIDGPWLPTPGEGLLDSRQFLPTLYRQNIICASSVLIRRSLYLRLGPFVECAGGERFACDDYDYWLRALASDAVFFYDPRVHVRYRRHATNATRDQTWVHRSRFRAHRWHADNLDDPDLVSAVLAKDLSEIARAEVEEGDYRSARASFAESLRHKITPRALVFALVLSLSERHAQRVTQALVALKRLLVRRAERQAPSSPG
jgi:glycosyltransferase involved in cell wall biosynthesis